MEGKLTFLRGISAQLLEAGDVSPVSSHFFWSGPFTQAKPFLLKQQPWGLILPLLDIGFFSVTIKFLLNSGAYPVKDRCL